VPEGAVRGWQRVGWSACAIAWPEKQDFKIGAFSGKWVWGGRVADEGAHGPSHSSNTIVDRDLAVGAGGNCGGGGDCERRKVDT
jgi:hypothetical protein